MRLIIPALLTAMLMTLPVAGQHDPLTVDVTRGRPLHPEVLGHNWSFFQDYRLPQYARSMRGVAAGLQADTYDWKRRTGSNALGVETTLAYLRACRDTGMTPMVTTNVRGITAGPSDSVYTDTSAGTLAQLAGDWVYYTNHILPTYRQGDAIDDPRATRILGELNWGEHDMLLAPGEPLTPRVVLWQIGNEPVARAGETADGKTLRFNHDAAGYVRNYRAVAEALAASGGDILIGPCFSGGDARAIDKPDRAFARELFASDARIDFITYQPYMHLQERWPDQRAMAEELRKAHAYVPERHHDPLVRALIEAGRDPKQIRLGVSEYNVAGWHDSSAQMSMARALGVADMLFAMADLDYVIGSMWDPMGHHGVTWPVYHLATALYDHLGDLVLAREIRDDGLRIYVTRDNQTGRVAVWSVNVGDTPATTAVDLQGARTLRLVEARQLGDADGTTTLLDRNTMLDPDKVRWSPADAAFEGSTLWMQVEPYEIALAVLETGVPPVVLSRQQWVQRVPSITEVAASREIADQPEGAGDAADLDEPQKPGDVTAEATDAGIVVTWKPARGTVEQYAIERSFDAIDYPVIGTVSGEQTRFVDDSAEPGMTYRYRVEARNAAGGSGPTDLVFVTVPGGSAGSSASPLVEIDVAPPTVQQEVLAHWPLDAEHGYRDVAGLGHDGQPHGDPTFDTVDGRAAVILDGEDDYIEVPDLPHMVYGPGYGATLSAWFRTTGEGVLFSRNLSYRGPGKSEYNLMLLGDGRLRWTGGALYRGFKPVQGFSETRVNDGRWHHVAVVLDHDRGTMYLDGKPDVTWQIDWSLPQDISMLIGARRLTSTDDVGSFFGGAIADVRFEQRALTAEEIAKCAAK